MKVDKTNKDEKIVQKKIVGRAMIAYLLDVIKFGDTYRCDEVVLKQGRTTLYKRWFNKGSISDAKSFYNGIDIYAASLIHHLWQLENTAHHLEMTLLSYIGNGQRPESAYLRRGKELM